MIPDIQKAVKKAVINVGFIVFTGPQGVGKTSCVSALLRMDFKKAAKQRYKYADKFTQQLRATGDYPKLRTPKHIYYSNTDIALSGTLKRPKVKCWWIDTQRLALPNDLFDTQYFPRGCIVFISEADLQLGNRDWNGLNNYMIALLKFVRHNEMTIIFDVQQDGMLDKALRGLETERYEVLAKTDMSRFVKRNKWKIDWSRPQLLSSRADKVRSGVKFNAIRQSEAYKRINIRYRGDIYKCYNSFTGVNYFIWHLENYDTIKHPTVNFTINSVNEYVDMFPLVRQAKNDKALLTRKRKEQIKTLLKDKQ